MAQYEMNLRDYWLIVRRRRWTIVGSMLLAVAFSFWFAKQKVPVYQASAAVKFEQSTSLSGLMLEVLSYNPADSIETQATLIKSYPILEEVARRMGRLPQTANGAPLRESRAYTTALDGLGAKLHTSRVPSTSILEIMATSPNPREARDLANTVAEVYRDYNRTNRNARIVEARKFIEAQLREIEGRVKHAEEEMWAYRDANRVIAPGAESSVLLSLFTQLRTDIEKTRQQRTELEQVAARLARTDANSLADRVYVDTQNPAMQKLVQTQTDLLLERNNLALEVTHRHPRLQAIDDRLREVRAEMRREVNAQVALLRNREDILGRQMGDLMQKNREVPAIELNLARLQRDAKVNDDLLTLLTRKHQEALIKESEGVDEVTIVRPASEPTAPVGGETLNTLFVGALLGLVLGLVFAFVQETLDTSIGTIEDVESYLEVPVLGIVPHIDPRETVQRLIERRPELASIEPDVMQSHALLITHFDPKSPVAEAYRTLRTNIQFQRMERAGKVLVVTSPTLQEGKTTTIVNLALTMAQNGQRTLLVGGNLRRPSIYRFFGIPREPGLSNILVGNAQWQDCVRGVADILMGRFEMEDIMAAPGLDNLHIVEAGPIPTNPSELLSAPAMVAFLAAVREEYDIVLIDTPPILPVTDSAIVAAQADGVLLVYQAGKVGRLVLKRAKAHLEAAHAKVWGVVLNDVQTEVSGYTYTHYYTHYYGEETPGETPSRGPMQRAWDFVRTRLDFLRTRLDFVRTRLAGRAGGAATAVAQPPTTEASPPPGESTSTANTERSTGNTERLTGNTQRSTGNTQRRWAWRDRGLWIGAAVLLLPGAALGTLAVWHWGLFGPPASARALARQPVHAPTTPITPRLSSPPPQAPPAPQEPPATDGAAPPRLADPLAAPAPVPPVSVMPSASATAPAPAVSAPSVATEPAANPVAPMRDAVPMKEGALTKDTGPAKDTAIKGGPPTQEGEGTKASAALKEPAAARVQPAPVAARFAIEFGPFMTPASADQVERRLTQAGYQTMRLRQQTGAAVYAVLIERVPTAADARALVTSLREQGLGQATVLASDPITVRIGDPLPLRGAVQLAERVRAAGHQVRVAVQAGDAVAFVIRHGNFVSRMEAEAAGRELARLNLPPAQVVQVR